MATYWGWQTIPGSNWNRHNFDLWEQTDSIHQTPAGAYDTYGSEDTFNALVGSRFETLITAGLGDDTLNLNFGVLPEGLDSNGIPVLGTQSDPVLNPIGVGVTGHHVYGDEILNLGIDAQGFPDMSIVGTNLYTYNSFDNDTFNFINVDNVASGAYVVGRLGDFDYSRDTISIDGEILDLATVTADGVKLENGSEVKIVEFNGDYDDKDDPQIWLMIKNKHDGFILYSLEGVRNSPDRSIVYGYGTESDFVPGSAIIGDFSSAQEGLFDLWNNKSIDFEDPVNFLPSGIKAGPNGLWVSDADAMLGNPYHDYEITTVIDGTGETREIKNNVYKGPLYDYETVEEIVQGSEYNDVIAAGLNDDTVQAGAGDDTIWGGSGYDEIYAEAGNDTVWGNRGNDYIDGGLGDDYLSGDSANDTLEGRAGNDSLYGGDGDDRLDGGNGNDDLHGDDGADNLTGRGGEDTLSGGAGDDYLNGGSGNDDLNGGTGRDRLDGADGDDVLDGWDGNDALLGRSGDDTVKGGKGNDYLAGHNGDDALHGNEGKDKLYGGNGDDVIHGNEDSDTLYGQNGNDVLWGDQGKDYLDGGQGNDILNGGSGNDTMEGRGGNDTLSGNDGDDRLDGDLGDDYLDGGKGNDNITGMDGDDILEGRSGKDRLFGGDGNDRIDAGNGNDLVVGGAGRDDMSGRSGDDTFRFGKGDMLVWNSENSDLSTIDVINDFRVGKDTIQFAGHDDASSLSDLEILQINIGGNKHFVVKVSATDESILVDVADSVTQQDFANQSNFDFI